MRPQSERCPAKRALPNAKDIYAGKETDVQLNCHWKATVSAHMVLLDRTMRGIKQKKKHALSLRELEEESKCQQHALERQSPLLPCESISSCVGRVQRLFPPGWVVACAQGSVPVCTGCKAIESHGWSMQSLPYVFLSTGAH